MKALLITLVVVIAAVWAIVEFGGVTSFDPEAQMAEFKQAAVPGADWEDLAGMMKPSGYRNFYTDADGFESSSVSLPYRAELFKENYDAGEFADGFILEFQQGAHILTFDGNGKLESGAEGITTKDLIDGTAVQKMKEQAP